MTTVSSTLPDGLHLWLEAEAGGLDRSAAQADAVLPQLAAAGLPAVGVPVARGGDGGDVVDAVRAVSAVAERSVTAAFVFWGHRTYIEYLLQSPNTALGDRLLPDLLAGHLAGATGLSNAMKFLAGLEPLQIAAREDRGGLRLDGQMPWVTNLRPQAFHVAAVVDAPGGAVAVVSLAHDDPGLQRSADLDLMAMRASNTAAVALANAVVAPDRILHGHAREWLPKVRPAFLGLQCGLSIGLARRALGEARVAAGAGRGVLGDPLIALARRLDQAESHLFAGLRSGEFEAKAAPLFDIRIDLADIASEAVALELQALGGRAYLSAHGDAFARRWREAAFIPIVTPSLVQLRAALAALRPTAA